MRILIVEDEPIHARELKALLTEMPGSSIESIQHRTTVTAAEFFMLENQIDLLFLDLNIFGEDGFDLLKCASSSSFMTVIVSAHTDRAIEAFDLGILDFIPKPVNKDRLKKAMERFHAARHQNRNNLKYFSIMNDASVEILPLHDVIYFESDGKKLKVHLKNQEVKICRKKLNELESILPDHFYKIHKSYLLNLNFLQKIKAYPGGKYESHLKNGSVIPISRMIYSQLRKTIDGETEGK